MICVVFIVAERKDAIFNCERQIEEARELVSLLILAICKSLLVIMF